MRTLGVRLLLLLAVPSCSWLSAQEETIVLGRRSSISAPEEPSQTIVIGEGARLRERPDPDSAVMEVFATSIELPVLERQGPWVQVRFGVWLGWVDIDAGGKPPSIDLPVNPDIARLERALEIFGRRPAPGSLGPFTLFTDVEDPRTLDRLAAVAEGAIVAYRSRYGLDPQSLDGAAVVIFAEEDAYRRFEAQESRLVGAHSLGFTSEALSILFTGGQQKVAIEALLVHELVHLLGRRVFAGPIPPWLDEGMAQDLALSRIEVDGRIRPGTLSTVDPPPGTSTVRGGSRVLSAAETHLVTLLGDWNSPYHPGVADLTTLAWQEFIDPERRIIRYSKSALLVRYLLDGGDKRLREGFLGYLAELKGTELAESIPLFPTLGKDPDRIDAGLYLFISRLAEAHGLI